MAACIPVWGDMPNSFPAYFFKIRGGQKAIS